MASCSATSTVASTQSHPNLDSAKRDGRHALGVLNAWIVRYPDSALTISRPARRAPLPRFGRPMVLVFNHGHHHGQQPAIPGSRSPALCKQLGWLGSARKPWDAAVPRPPPTSVLAALLATSTPNPVCRSAFLVCQAAAWSDGGKGLQQHATQATQLSPLTQPPSSPITGSQSHLTEPQRPGTGALPAQSPGAADIRVLVSDEPCSVPIWAARVHRPQERAACAAEVWVSV
jgi:hypothetical protein